MSLDYFGADADPTLDDVRAGRVVLKNGSHGDAVVYVQALAGAIADGDYGTKTETAVRAFQRANGLTVDGEVGKETIAALDRLAMAAPGATQARRPVDAGAGELAKSAPPPRKKMSPLVYAGVAVAALATGGTIWLVTR